MYRDASDPKIYDWEKKTSRSQRTVKSHLVEEGEAGDEVVHGGLGVHAANQLLGVVAVKQVN